MGRTASLSLVLVSLLHAATASADEPLTLKEALRQAVTANRTLLGADVDVSIAEAQVVRAEGADGLVFDAKASLRLERTTPIEGQVLTPLEIDRLDLGGGVSWGLGTGGRVGLSVADEYARTLERVQLDPAAAPQDFEVVAHRSSVTLTLFQPILRGVGDASPARVERRRAVAARTVEELQRARVASAMVRDVIEAYWELWFAQRELAIKQGLLDMAREQLRLTQARLDANMGPRTDLGAVRRAIALRQEDVILAEVAALDHALALRRLVGLDTDPGDPSITTEAPPAVPTEEPTILDAIEAALASNTELAVLRARRNQAELEVDVTENGLLPQLDLVARGGPIGRARSFEESVAKVAELESYELEVGVALSVPLDNRASRGAHRAAKGALRKARLSQSDLEAQVGEAVTRAVTAVSAARRRIEVLRSAADEARGNLGAERVRFEARRASNFDVLDRQAELAETQLRQARAEADHLQSQAVLQSLTGELLDAHGVTLKSR